MGWGEEDWVLIGAKNKSMRAYNNQPEHEPCRFQAAQERGGIRLGDDGVGNETNQIELVVGWIQTTV